MQGRFAQNSRRGFVLLREKHLERHLTAQARLESKGLSDRWSITQNAAGFVAERRRLGAGEGFVMSGATRDTLLRRIEAWEREQVANGRAA